MRLFGSLDIIEHSDPTLQDLDMVVVENTVIFRVLRVILRTWKRHEVRVLQLNG